jgi:DNA-nicking Smr family endonuclease
MKPRPAGARPKRPAVAPPRARIDGSAPKERDLFLSAIDGTRPLGSRDRQPVEKAPPSPVRAEVLPPVVALAVEGDGRRYSARAPGVSLAQAGELRKAHVEDTLDLHGETVERGVAALSKFLLESRRLGRRCVLVVHGRGLHSDAGAPLREAVLAQLLGPLSGLVHALASAAHEGATYIALRGPK